MCLSSKWQHQLLEIISLSLKFNCSKNVCNSSKKITIFSLATMIIIFLFLPLFSYTRISLLCWVFFPPLLKKNHFFFPFCFTLALLFSQLLPSFLHSAFPSCSTEAPEEKYPQAAAGTHPDTKPHCRRHNCAAPEHPGRGSSLHFTTDLSPKQISLERKFCFSCSSLKGLWSVWNSLSSSLLRSLACQETALSSSSNHLISW